MEHLSSTSFLLSAAIILIACYLLVYVIRPYQTYLFYKQLLTAHYKAKVRPFKVSNKLYFDFMFDDIDKRGDIAYTIKQSTSWSIATTNKMGSSVSSTTTS